MLSTSQALSSEVSSLTTMSAVTLVLVIAPFHVILMLRLRRPSLGLVYSYLTSSMFVGLVRATLTMASPTLVTNSLVSLSLALRNDGVSASTGAAMNPRARSATSSLVFTVVSFDTRAGTVPSPLGL